MAASRLLLGLPLQHVDQLGGERLGDHGAERGTLQRRHREHDIDELPREAVAARACVNVATKRCCGDAVGKRAPSSQGVGVTSPGDGAGGDVPARKRRVQGGSECWVSASLTLKTSQPGIGAAVELDATRHESRDATVVSATLVLEDSIEPALGSVSQRRVDRRTSGGCVDSNLRAIDQRRDRHRLHRYERSWPDLIEGIEEPVLHLIERFDEAVIRLVKADADLVPRRTNRRNAANDLHEGGKRDPTRVIARPPERRGRRNE